MRVLHVFATHTELGGLADELEHVCVTGVGKAAAAAGVARELATKRFERVIVAGVAGAYRHGEAASSLSIGDACVVRDATFGDEGVVTPTAFLDLARLGLATESAVETYDVALVAAARRSLGGAPAVRVATVSSCSGDGPTAQLRQRRTGAAIETMESAAIAYAARVAGVPLVEVRTISNWCGPRRDAAWDLDRAILRLAACVRSLCADRGTS